jgi:hypothetical protein
MPQFRTFAPVAAVSGEAILLVVTAFGEGDNRGKEILAQCGIPNPQPGKWYPQQALLNALWRILQTVGAQPLWKTGALMSEGAQWPPEVTTIDQALAALDLVYHAHHRGEVGHYQFEKTGARSGIMVCQTPYADDFDRGLIGAVNKKFKPQDVKAVLLRHEEAKPCRKKGADSCTLTIRW